MRLTRVHLPPPLATGLRVDLPAGAARHLTRVLRMGEGEALRAFDGTGGEFDGVIETIRRDAVCVRIGAHHAIERESPLDVTLLQGIARGEKMDLILQKATELGVTRVLPLTSLRSNVRLTSRTAQQKREHWQGVVASACGQCGRNRVPAVAPPASLAESVQQAAPGLRLVLVPDAGARDLRSRLAEAGNLPVLPPVTLLIGPEGGLDPGELRVAKLAGFVSCTLGPRVLRTETAALVALAVLQFAAGDLAGGQTGRAE